MTSTRYLGSITPPPPSISVVAGGGDINTKANTWYFWLVNRCVGGFTKASATSASGVVAVGDRIDITIPSSARTSGSDVREFYVLANTINNVSTASIIASYPGYTLDGTAQSPNDYSEVLTVLPGSLSVSTDEQLELNKFITLEADLPTGVDLLNGMIRHVDEVGAYLTYNAALDDWYQLFPNTTNPNVGVTTDPVQLGCDRDIRSIAVSAKNQIITPIYGLSGSSRSVPVIIVNTGTTAILQGKPIEAQLNIGGEDYLRYAVFTPRGIVDLTTGLVDTTDQPSIGGSFPGDGQGGAVIAIEKDLDAGKGFWFDIRLSFSPEDLGNQLREGSLVEFYADFSPFNSKLSPDAGVFGDIIGPVADHGRVVPNGPVLAPIVTSRAGKIRGYVFPAQGESLGASDVIGVLSNTAEQNIVLTNNGIAYHAVTTPPTASLRAIISTENGVGEATAFAGSYVVDATKYLTLTIAHPDTVRGDYPDIVGVQQQPAVLNAGKVRVYTRPTGGGSITYFDAVLTGGVSDVVQVGQSGGTVIADLPVVDADFGLFTPETYIPEVSIGASVFTASTIEVAIAYLYEETMTRVTHDPIDLEIEATAQGDSSRYVRELSSSIWALFTLLDTIGFPLSTVVEAKAMTLDDLAANKLFFIAETEKIYYWNATSTAINNDETIIAVTGIVTGRLIAVSGSGGSNATQIIDADATLSSESGVDYFVDATAGNIILTLPEVASMSGLLKHKLIRIDSTANSITVNCSGLDLLNDSTASTFLGAEIVVLSPNKITGTGYLTSISYSPPLDRKRRLHGGVTLYVSPLGNDNNSGLSSLPGEALQTIEGVADRINSLEAYWFEVYLEPGANIDVTTISQDVRFAPSSSIRQRSDGSFIYTYIDFYGDEITPPVLTFNGVFDRVLLEGLNTVYSFYSVDFSLSAAASDKAPLQVQGLGTYLYVSDATVTRTAGTYTFVKANGGADVTLVDISTVGSLIALVNADRANVATLNALTLDAFTNAIFDLKNQSFLNQDAAVTLAGVGKQFTLDTGSVIKDNGIAIPGAEGDIKDSGSSISSYPLPTFRSVDLGTYSVTGTAIWDLRDGYGAFDAAIAIAGGSITLSVTNPPTIDYTLTGVLDIDAALGDIILPVAWTLTPDSADPNDATGVYRFIVRHSVTLATTYVIFSPITGGVSQDVDLAYTASPTNGIVTNTKGTDATIPLADVTNAGLLAPADKSTIDATSGANTGDQSFTVASPTQPDITLDVVTSTLNLVGSGVTITQNDLTNTVTFSVTAGTDPMTTRGDLIYRNPSNVTARLGVGATGQVLGTDGLDVFWTTPTGGGITNLGYTASPTNGIVTSDTGTDATITLADATNAGLMSPADFTKLGGVEALADVTDTANVTAAGALMDSEVTSLSGIKTLTVSDNTTISTFGATLVDDATASDARTTLGLGTAATQNTGTAIGNIVLLQNVGGIAGLPAVDGSLLTGLPSGFADPMTTIGDIIIRNGSNVTARLGIGTTGQVLTVTGGIPTWAAPTGLTNPVAYVTQSIQAVTYNSGGNSTLDNGTHNTFTLSANGASTTIVHSNVPATGTRYAFELHLNWVSGAITFPAAWTKGDAAPAAIGDYVITGITLDGGTSWKIAVLAE